MTVQQTGKIDSLTGIRAIAALWVVLHHYPHHSAAHPYSLLDYGIFAPLVHKGYLGVDLFFVLSGFIIAYVYQPQFMAFQWRVFVRFLCLRLARLYPVHLFMLFMGMANFMLLKILSHGALPQPAEKYLPEQLMASLLLLHGWGIEGGNWNGPSWSISSEWFAYLLFPVTVALFWKHSKSVLVFSALLITTLLLAVLYSSLAGIDAFVNSSYLIRVMLGFSLGVFVYNLYRQNSAPSRVWDYSAALVVLMAVLFLYRGQGDAFLLLFFAAFLYCLARSSDFILRAFSHPVVVHLGEISYSLYLVHGIVLLGWAGIFIRNVLVPNQLGGGWHGLAFVAFIAVVLVCSELTYRYIELPCRNYFRKIIDKKYSL